MMNNDELLIAMADMFDKKVEEVKLHTGVLVEDLRKDVKAIAEGHSILDRKIDNLHKEMTETKQELKAEIKGLAIKVGGLEQKVDGLEQKVGGLEQKVDGLEQKVDGLEKNMTVVKDYVIGVDSKLNEHEIILKRVK